MAIKTEKTESYFLTGGLSLRYERYIRNGVLIPHGKFESYFRDKRLEDVGFRKNGIRVGFGFKEVAWLW